jgi:hypothetical protein
MTASVKGLVGKHMKIEYESSPGIWTELSGQITSLSLQSMPAIEVTGLGDAEPSFIPGMPGTEFTIDGFVGPDGLLTFMPSERYDEEGPMLRDTCRFCGSGWSEDMRGNCKACGAPKEMAFYG